MNLLATESYCPMPSRPRRSTAEERSPSNALCKTAPPNFVKVTACRSVAKARETVMLSGFSPEPLKVLNMRSNLWLGPITCIKSVSLRHAVEPVTYGRIDVIVHVARQRGEIDPDLTIAKTMKLLGAKDTLTPMFKLNGVDPEAYIAGVLYFTGRVL
jgi:hypothetical protein